MAVFSATMPLAEEENEAPLDVTVQKIQYAVESFKSSREFNEVAVQQLLSLLHAEKVLVDHLLNGEFGYKIEKDIIARNNMLTQTVPSVVTLYNGILDLATQDEKLDTSKNNKYLEAGKLHKLYLSRKKRLDFLHHMHETLTYYCDHFHSLQWELADKWIPKTMRQQRSFPVQHYDLANKVANEFAKIHFPIDPKYFDVKKS
jgi:hypothetical protein